MVILNGYATFRQQVCMVIVVVYWLMRSKGLIGSSLVHEVHFNRKLNTLLCMQSYSKPKE